MSIKDKLRKQHQKGNRLPFKELQPAAVETVKEQLKAADDVNSVSTTALNVEHISPKKIQRELSIGGSNSKKVNSVASGKQLRAKKQLLLVKKCHGTRRNPTKKVNCSCCCSQTPKRPPRKPAAQKAACSASTGGQLKEENEETENIVRDSDERKRLIERVLRDEDADRAAITELPKELKVAELELVRCGGDVSAAVMDYYLMDLLMAKVRQDNERLQRQPLLRLHVMPAEFATELMLHKYRGVAAFTKSIDIFAQDIVLVPARVGVENRRHWMLAAINMQTRAIHWYDCTGLVDSMFLTDLREYLRIEGTRKHRTPHHFHFVNGFQRQHHNRFNDSGVFCCICAVHVAQNVDWKYESKQFRLCRKKILLDIINKEIEEV